MNSLTLITPTSDRPRPFALCEKWMSRALQHYHGSNFQWIVVDDGVSPAKCTLGQQHIRLDAIADSTESFRQNLLAALQEAKHEIILFIEDDDWYAEQYLAKMCKWMTNDFDIVGETKARYYFLPTQRYHFCRNSEHASLCQTGIRRSLRPWIIKHLQRNKGNPYIDIALWREGRRRGKYLLRPQTTLSVGMKGLPGKTGIGMGHRLSSRHQHDVEGEMLRQWVGKDDAALYEKW